MQIGSCQYGVLVMVIKYLEKSVTYQCRSRGGPSIKDNKSSSGKSYGDLFVYEKSRRGNGLAVTGFRGDKDQTIIFQNRYGNENVIEIADNSFTKSCLIKYVLQSTQGY